MSNLRPRQSIVFLFCISLILALPLQAFSLILPPPPGTIASVPDASGILRPALIIDGVPVAFQYDDFWSFSAPMLDQVQAAGFIPASYGDYMFTSGLGTLDVVLYTQAGGADNQGVGPLGAFNFEDPAPTPAGNATTSDSWWGQNDQNNDGIAENPPGPGNTVRGPVTVGNVLSYLQAFDPLNDIPVFYLDLNQTGNEAVVLFNAQARIINHTTGAVIETWALDALTQSGNGDFDASAFTTAFPEFVATGTSGTLYNAQHNIGSGKPDFIGYAPTMTLSSYDPLDLFVVDFHFRGLNNGGEEIFMTGRIGSDITLVPEPGTIILLGSGLLGLAFLVRRKRMSDK